MIVWSSIVAAAFYLLAQTRLLVGEVAKAFNFGSGATAASTSTSMLLIGVGHLVGLAVGIAMFVGLLISWVFLVPYYTSVAAQPAGVELGTFVNDVFRSQVRFIGAGTIGVAAIWTLLRILGPIIAGIRGALAANRERKAGRGEALPLTERDLPIGIVGGSILLLMIPIGLVLYAFASTDPIASNPAATLIISIIYILIAGVVIAAITGYMAGLIGASNSPVSGVGILSVLGISLILAAIFPAVDPEATKALVAFALLVTAFIFGVATIANNNLQDLKTGQLVEATPWRQQVALVLGVIFGALVIPPVLDLLKHTRFSGRARSRCQFSRRSAGRTDFRDCPGHPRRRSRLGADRLGRPDRRGRGDNRRVAQEGQARVVAAAGGGHGHLFADVADAADPGWSAARPAL
jgi:putative OPT family oligopeptide transporter